jgi:hypothetical protein
MLLQAGGCNPRRAPRLKLEPTGPGASRAGGWRARAVQLCLLLQCFRTLQHSALSELGRGPRRRRAPPGRSGPGARTPDSLTLLGRFGSQFPIPGTHICPGSHAAGAGHPGMSHSRSGTLRLGQGPRTRRAITGWSEPEGAWTSDLSTQVGSLRFGLIDRLGVPVTECRATGTTITPDRLCGIGQALGMNQ